MTAKTKYRDVTCGECSRVFITAEPRKLFCDPCGIKRRSTSYVVGQRRQKAAQSSALKIIAEASEERSTSIVDAFHRPLEYAWSVSFTTPYSLNSSKNRRWSNTGHGTVYLSEAVRSYQNGLIALTRDALRDIEVRQAKLWISLFVQKENHKADAVNVVDTICDAVKVAVGLDDRWFCIGRLDWEIKKADPQIFIQIAQESEVDVIACSHCGSILPVENFNRHKGNPLGRSRVCRGCASIIGAEKRKVVLTPSALRPSRREAA